MCEEQSSALPFCTLQHGEKLMKGKILVLDDSDNYERELANVLQEYFFVVISKTQEDAQAIIEFWIPDVLVLDINDPKLGIGACKSLRALVDIPIIFASPDQSLATQIDVFEAGATDMLSKPVLAQALIHKVDQAIAVQQQRLADREEKQQLQTMAMGFLSNLGQSGILMNFVRESIRCKTFDELAEKLVIASQELGISCFGEIRGPNGYSVQFRSSGDTSPLESSVIAQLSSMGRIFQFKSQLVVNYPQVSMVAFNLPLDSEDDVGKIRDNIAILAETTDALCENVQVRQSASAHAEQLQFALMQANSAAVVLRDTMKLTMMDTRILLQELEDNINRAHSWLGTTNDQERAISSMMDESIQKTLERISAADIDEQINKVLAAISVSSSDNDLELF
jgi:DNA-binding NarL/FixJ family response regulator